MQKSRGKSTRLLPPLLGTRFQVLFHSPSGVLFTFPSRYLSAIGHLGVLSLGGWSPSFGPRFTGAVLLRNIIGRPERFTYGTVALYGARFHALPLRNGFLTPAS